MECYFFVNAVRDEKKSRLCAALMCGMLAIVEENSINYILWAEERGGKSEAFYVFRENLEIYSRRHLIKDF